MTRYSLPLINRAGLRWGREGGHMGREQAGEGHQSPELPEFHERDRHRM